MKIIVKDYKEEQKEPNLPCLMIHKDSDSMKPDLLFVIEIDTNNASFSAIVISSGRIIYWPPGVYIKEEIRKLKEFIPFTGEIVLSN